MPEAADAGARSQLWRRWLPAAPVELVLLHWGDAPPFELLLLARVLDEGVRRGGGEQLRWRMVARSDASPAPPASLLVLCQDPSRATPPLSLDRLVEIAPAAVLIGPAATWFAGTPIPKGQRVAVHWEDAAVAEEMADDVVPSPAIIEVHGRWTTCCGGFAVVDLGLLLLHELAGSGVAMQVMDALCMDRMREPSARQRTAAAGVFGELVPKLAEAIGLMEANVEETLQTDEIANLVGVSRRQLERLFKQHLSTVPSRYYLDMRLQRARKLLRETRHSLLQVALMCGFSSGSHFSTTYSSVFGITPREERQRVLSTIAR